MQQCTTLMLADWKAVGYSFSQLFQLMNPGAAIRSELKGAPGRLRLLGIAGNTTGHGVC